MKHAYCLLTLTTTLLLAGCAETRSIRLDSDQRAPTTSVDVFKDGDQPTKPSKQIAELSWKGRQADELKAQAYLMRQSEKLGGNAIVLSKVASGEHLSLGFFGGFGGATSDMEFLFKAKVLVYE